MKKTIKVVRVVISDVLRKLEPPSKIATSQLATSKKIVGIYVSASKCVVQVRIE